MGKVREFIARQRESYVAVIKRYAATVVATIVMSLVLCLQSMDVIGEEPTEDICVFLGFFICCAFFIETVLKSRTKAQPVSASKLLTAYLISAFVSVVVAIIVHMLKDTDNSFVEYYAAAILGFILLILNGFAMRRLIKDSELTFEQYAVKLMFSFLRMLTIVLVLNLGLLIILEMIDYLLVDIREWKIMSTIEYLLAGTVYTPFMLICLNVDDEEDSKFTRGLFIYALTPLYLVAMAIIYLYIFKLIFTMEFPSNSVFGICAGLFTLGVCIWTAAYSYVKAELDAGNYNESVKTVVARGGGHARYNKTFYDKLIIYMKYIYAPFLLLELYCVGVRIHEFGLTGDRILGVWFIIAQAIYIAWEPLYNLFLKIRGKGERIHLHERYEDYLFVVLVMYFFMVLCPFTNVNKMEYLSQKARFEREANSSSYRVLKNNIYGERYLEDEGKLGKEYELALKQDNPYQSHNKQHIYLTEGQSNYTGPVDVSGADTLFKFDNSNDNVFKDIEELKEFKITYGDQESLAVDLSNLVDDMMEDEKYSNGKHVKQAELPYTINGSDGSRVVITYISFTYSTDGYEGICVRGYVMR